MDIDKGLLLRYDDMDASRDKAIRSFLENLPISVVDCGLDGDSRLIVSKYRGNDSIFCLTPVERQVEYRNIQRLGRKYEVGFSRRRLKNEGLVDQVFVGLKKDPYTGIYLRTGPIIHPSDSSQ